MFGRFFGAVVSAPFRAVEVLATVCESVDCLNIADAANNAANSLQESVEYILDGDDDA